MIFFNNIIVICGPTASGKSQLALNLCKDLISGVIINADAIQVYKAIPILTAQPTQQDKQHVNHKLYGFLEADQKYSVANWLDDVIVEIDQALCKKLTPILVGGTGMYIHALINGIRVVDDIPQKIINMTNEIIKEHGIQKLYEYLTIIDKNTENYTTKNDISRITRLYNLYQSFKITPSEYNNLPNKIFFSKDRFKVLHLSPDREKLYQNANQRFIEMLDNGAINEVRNLFDKGINEKHPISKAIGYKELCKYFLQEISIEDSISKSQQATRNYIKRQTTWFKNQLNNVDNIKENNIIDLINSLKQCLNS